MAFCPGCGSQVADNAAACPACGRALGQAGAAGTATAPAAVPASAGLPDNTAGMLAYITIIPAIIFLVMEPYNKRPFVRFHAWQCIMFAVAWTVLWIAMMIVGAIPVIGWMTIFLWPIIGIGALILWIVLLIKANSGQMWKLPIIGDIAEKQANAM